MRITTEVRKGNYTESGLILLDKEGNSFHWLTKHYSHPLFFGLDYEYFLVSMTVTDDMWGLGKNAKNVRIIKKN